MRLVRQEPNKPPICQKLN